MRVIEEGGARVELREVDGVHVHAWIGQASVLTVDAYYEELETIVERGERLVIVTETSQAGVPGADVRARIGVRQNALEPRLRPLSQGNVVVVQDTLLRGALTALTWIIPSLADIEYVETLDEAMTRARVLRSE